MKLKIKFLNEAETQYEYFKKYNKKLAAKILVLIENMKENPFTGIGKPEPLKHNLSGLWSRRIDKKNRLIYKVTKTEIVIISCKGHYE